MGWQTQQRARVARVALGQGHQAAGALGAELRERAVLRGRDSESQVHVKEAPQALALEERGAAARHRPQHAWHLQLPRQWGAQEDRERPQRQSPVEPGAFWEED